VRTVAIPAAIRAELVAHLAEFVDAGEGGHVDQGPDGANGHDDMRAALIYQRATSDADRLSALIDEHRGQAAPKDRGDEDDDGASGSLIPVA
jgi:hypothetical protein